MMADRAAAIEFFSYPDRAAQAQALADEVALALKDACSSRAGGPVLAVSGGKSPVAFFQALSVERVPWMRVSVVLVDERWVPVDHEESNEALVRRHLLQGPASRARLFGFYRPELRPEEVAAGCEGHVPPLASGIDVLILGMGEDGHTASLFPGCDGLREAVDIDSTKSCAVTVPQGASRVRITLTLVKIVSAHRLFLLIQGGRKKEVLEQAVAAGPPEEKPIRFVLDALARAGRRLLVHWAP